MRTVPVRRLSVLLLPAMAVALAAQSPRDRHVVGPEPFTMRVVASDLGNPWDLAWGPDGQLWVTERTGSRVTRLDPTDGSRRIALTLNDVYQSVEQDGLMGTAFHADETFLAYTYNRDSVSDVVRGMRIRRYRYD